MILSRLVKQLRKYTTQKNETASLDKRLVDRLREKRLPSLSQFKYIRVFLNPKEKKLLWLSSLLVIIGMFGLLAQFGTKHIIQKPKIGGEYIEGLIGQPKYLNPLFSSANDVDSDITSLLYRGLFSSNNTGIQPNLAESYTVSPDGKTYTISLKKNEHWSDGETITADDVIFTIESISNPEVGSPLIAAFQGVQTEKVDDATIRFTLKEPYAPFLENLTVGILPAHIWDEIAPSNLRLTNNNLQPVGSGPWMFSKLKKDSGAIQTYSLVPNPYFSGKKPYFKNLTFKFFPDYSSALEALKGQSITALGFIPHDDNAHLTTKNLNLFKLTLPQYTAIFFNQNQQPFLKNDSVRKALVLAIDRSLLIEKGLYGAGHITNSPLVNLSIPASTTFQFDKQKAMELLDAAAWTRIEPEEYFKLRSEELNKTTTTSTTVSVSSTPAEITAAKENNKQINSFIRQEMNPDQPFYRKDKNGNILSIVITTADTPEYRRVGELIASMWRTVGVKTVLQTISPRQIAHDTIKPRAYEALLYGEIIGEDPDPFPFWHSSQINSPGLNLSLYANRNTDKLLEDARETTDAAKRNELYKKFQEILVSDIPAIFLYIPEHTFAVNKSIKGIELGQLNAPEDRFKYISDWYIKTSLGWK